MPEKNNILETYQYEIIDNLVIYKKTTNGVKQGREDGSLFIFQKKAKTQICLVL